MKITKIKIASVVMIALVLVTGCMTGMAAHDGTFDGRASLLACEIYKNSQEQDTSIHTVAVTTFVGLGPLKWGSYFGRQVSERMAYELQIQGYRVFELRKGADMSVLQDNGEFLLSRELDKVVTPYKADAVLVGTFQRVGRVVTVHARLLDAETSRVISVATAHFSENDDYTAALLNEADLREKDEDFAFEAAMPKFNMAIRERKADKAEKALSAPKLPGEMRELTVEATDSAPKTLTLMIDQLIRDVTRKITPGKTGQTVAVASFVDLDKLNRTNTFGRYLTEAVMDRMASRGYAITETRAARELMVQPNVGEQGLSRELEEIKEGPAADVLVLGTYTMAGDTLVVHARMVSSKSRQVVSEGKFQMNVRPGDPFIKRMFEEPYERVGENNYSDGRREK